MSYEERIRVLNEINIIRDKQIDNLQQQNDNLQTQIKYRGLQVDIMTMLLGKMLDIIIHITDAEKDPKIKKMMDEIRDIEKQKTWSIDEKDKEKLR